MENLLENLKKVVKEEKIQEQEELKHPLDQLRKHLDKIKSLLDEAEHEAHTALEDIFDRVAQLDIVLGDEFERIYFAIQEAQHKLVDFNKHLK